MPIYCDQYTNVLTCVISFYLLVYSKDKLPSHGLSPASHRGMINNIASYIIENMVQAIAIVNWLRYDRGYA